MCDDTDVENFDSVYQQFFNNDIQGNNINYKGVCLPEHYTKFSDAIENFKVQDDDVWLCSFVKAGTTWAQEMIWCIANDVDLEGAKVDLFQRFPFFEVAAVVDYSVFERKNPAQASSKKMSMTSIEFCETRPRPRFIKTHLPFHLLPRELRDGCTQAKIIYISRNPKDTCISYYHHAKLMKGYRGDFNLFCKLFLADKLNYCPYWDHILGFWNQRNNPNLKICFLKFEQMKSNLPLVIHNTTKFIEKPPLSPEKLEILVDHLSFAKMKNNKAVNKDKWIDYMKQLKISTTDEKFMRCGEVDQWKTQMSPEMSKKFDEWTSQKLKLSDFVV